MDSLQKERDELRQQVSERLHKGYNPEPENVERLLQVLILPSFGNFLSIEIFRCKQFGEAALHQYLAVWIAWRKDIDYTKLENPVTRLKYPYPLVPTYEAFVLDLDDSFVEDILSSIYKLPTDIDSDCGIVIDGTIAKLIIDSAKQYEWYYEPRTAEPLNQIVDTVLQYVQQYIPYKK